MFSAFLGAPKRRVYPWPNLFIPANPMLNGFRSPRRVVITGMGCVTPIGIGREAFWNSLQTGISGVRRIESFDVSDSPVKIAAEVRDFDWQSQLTAKDRKHVPRTVPLASAPPACVERLATAWPAKIQVGESFHRRSSAPIRLACPAFSAPPYCVFAVQTIFVNEAGVANSRRRRRI